MEINWEKELSSLWKKGKKKDVSALRERIFSELKSVGWEYDTISGPERDSEEHHEAIFRCGMALGAATKKDELIKMLKTVRVGRIPVARKRRKRQR